MLDEFSCVLARVEVNGFLQGVAKNTQRDLARSSLFEIGRAAAVLWHGLGLLQNGSVPDEQQRFCKGRGFGWLTESTR